MAEPKVTWGGYFASYVRKKPPAEAPVATAAPKDDGKAPPPNVLNPVDISAGQETKPKTASVKKPSEGFQRSTSGTKKLYAIPKEPVVSEALAVQRSASNASRLAKMFGYSGNSSAPPEPEKIEELPVAPLIAMVEAQEITEKLSAAPIRNVPKPEMMPTVEAALQYTKKDTVVPIIQKTRKDDTQDMLDYFARQLETPVDENSTLAGKKRFDTPESKAIDTIVVEKPAQTPVRAKPKAVDMLDFLVNQLDSPNDNLASASGKMKEDSRVVNETKPTQSKAKALDMLDFFSSQLDSIDPKPAPPATKKTDVPGALPAQTEMPPITRKDSMWSRQGSATSSELNMVMKGRKISDPRPQSSSKPVEVSMETRRTPSRYGFGDEQLRLERELMEAERERMLQLEKQAEIIISEREQMDLERQTMLEEQARFDEEAKRIAEEEESMRKFIENVERERQLDFENQEKKRIRREAEEAELRRIAAEQEAERLRIQMEEEAEQRRIAAEQEAERLRIKMEEDARKEAERVRIKEQDDARRAAEIEAKELARETELERRRAENANREEADRLAAETRRSEEEAEHLYYEEQERIEEAAGRQSRADKEREEEERYEIALADEEARLREVDRQKRRAAQLANSEVQARADERIERETRRAMAEKADRAYEQEEAERARAVGADRLADAYKFDMDVTGQPMISPSVYEDELYEDESDEDEKNEDEMEEDEMEEDEMEEYEEEEREETKEEKLQKAEEKIRLAFAGMAEERARQPSAAIPSPNPIREDTRMMRNDRMPMPMPMPIPTAGRNLNVGNQNARPRPDVGGSRFNTAGGAGAGPRAGAAGPRPPIRGGLPSGPRGGGGLPGGPRPRR
ncbi:uncharacterized protein L3040_007395 [Drepanopeziza brunnea f. sp. 'multigermtubi']|uniref:uncharacterized protein n=1 Tax=Drepanopeziza brunnea f. sp. 'multigermtubi' TaxID=698441 RepID=UPI002396ADBC|nr:hypothetical protein L3040_007395 [Drepanopeziza brunnea f. sp. 'multigermtubi']